MLKSSILGAVAICFLPIFASAHSIEETIADCACDSACYTDEVSGLSCSANSFSFHSNTLPSSSHPIMSGITGSNQQFPTAHNFTATLPRNPVLASRPTATEAGAVGIAVNGVPIFDPSTQGPIQASTGKPVSAAEQGELDECGGHAGRGDDYHYHVAPSCLIEELGREAIEVNRQPIGYAADGFPILALGWYDSQNDIEAKLDECRGATDGTGQYFYNVQHAGDYAVLDCLSGTSTRWARDDWDQRRDADGQEITGAPIGFAIASFEQSGSCLQMSGTLLEEQLKASGGEVSRVRNLDGTLFHCSQSCYGHFVETSGGRGRTMKFEAVISGCSSGFSPARNNGFLAYQ